ncbi:MAG: N-acetyltransferase [Haloplasmataceae bacterium]|jgi:hypothetical protein|nr:N-acetyltransferase [Haloplasmataceae bacterium]
MTFWEKTQDEVLKKLFPFSNESLEKTLVLFDDSIKEDALSYGKVSIMKVNMWVIFGVMVLMNKMKKWLC